MLTVLLGGLPAIAASRQVTGTVTDLQGEPLVGASIMLQNSRTGCMADLDGKFSLQVPDGTAHLKIALIGYRTESVKVAPNQTVVNVKMQEDSQTLEETVVVGYGTQKKVNLTGAVAAIEGKSLEGRPVSNVSTMLQGSVAGLNVSTTSGKPGSTAQLNIRGITSINGASPLVLVDGAIGDIDTVDPNDVQSISVIKDASAAAVYGARAAFGVILVTTKSGAESDGKATVRYNGRFGWDEPTTNTDFETSGYWWLRTSDEFQRGQNGAALFDGDWNDNDWMQLLLRVGDKTENPDRPWVVTEGEGSKARWKYYGNNDYWHQIFNDRKFTTQHNVSLSGGSKAVRYFVSGSYKHNDGMAKFNNDKYNQYNLRTKVDFNINKWAKFSQNVAYYGSSYTYQGDGSMENTISYAAESGSPIFPLTNPDGSYIYANYIYGYKPGNGRHIMMMQGLHPGEQRKTDFSTTSRLDITPIKQLTFTGDFTYRFHQNRNNTRSNSIPYRQAPNEAMKYYSSGAGQDDYKESMSTFNYYSANALVTYKDTYADAHNLTVVAGYNYENRNYKTYSTYVQALGIPELSDLGLATTMDGVKVTGNQSDYFLQGIFGRINYDYMGKYLLELSGRYDGTSRFAKGHRWGFFPSGSLGWRFSEEKFFESLNPTWTNGKVRFSYGCLGNQNTSNLYTFLRTVSTEPFTSSYAFTTDGTSWAKYAKIDAPIAEDFTWEKTYQYDLGLDLGFFNNRLNATVDLYIRDTKNMITTGKTLPAVYGATFPKMNAADLRTKGYEVSLEWNDAFALGNNRFTYNVGFNISQYHSKITKFDNPNKSLTDYYEGMEYGEIWGYKTDGFFATTEEAQKYAQEYNLSEITKTMWGGWQAGDLKFLDLNGDKAVNYGKNQADNSGDKVKLGNELPRLQYGFRAGFSYFGFDVNAIFQGTGNHYWYPSQGTVNFWGPFSTYLRCSFLPETFKDNYWTEDNPDAYFPRARGKGAANSYLQFTNDRYLQNLRYLRFKNLTVGYTFPKKWTSKALIQKLRLYFTAENLAYWSPLKKHTNYIDPEACINRKDGNKFLGVDASENAHSDMAFYPWPKTFTFGIDLQF